MNPAPSKSAMYTAFVYTCFAWSCRLVQPPAPHNAARTNLLASTESERC